MFFFEKNKNKLDPIFEDSKQFQDDGGISEKIASYFYAYAHPPLFSFVWRHHRRLAHKIAFDLYEHPNWNRKECNTYIHQTLDDYNLAIKEAGTFDLLIKKIQEELKPDPQNSNGVKNTRRAFVDFFIIG